MISHSQAIMLGKLLKSKEYSVSEKNDIIDSWIEKAHEEIRNQINSISYLEHRKREVHNGRQS